MKSILIVDDVATNLICASEVLKPYYKVSTAKSGKQALLMLQEEIYDLIILDINMPHMNGYEVMEKLKENPELSSIPVVFLTAESDMVNEVKGLEMGAMDFIKKPFDPEVVKTRIDKILSMKDEKTELEDAVNRDSLTDLFNRKNLEKFLLKEENATGYFLLMDLDNFKAVNDTYGHVVGDAVLIRIAKVFKEIVKDVDRICRLGGDEFAIFLSSEFTEEDIKNLCRRLIATCEFEISDILAEYSDFKVSVSIGISIRPSDGDSFQELYNNADKALYLVKQNGKRGYYFYNSMGGLKDEFEDENYKIDMLQLQKLISETEYLGGAYKVEYEGFKRIYRFVSRCMDRKNEDVQIVLFTLTKNNNEGFGENDENMSLLEEAITGSLRRGDVATKCGKCQYIVILMDADQENGDKVAKRIEEKFLSLAENSEIAVSYEMKTIDGNK